MSDSTIQVLEGILGNSYDGTQMVSGLDATVSLGADAGVGSFSLGKLKWPLIGLGAAAAAFFGYRWWKQRALRSSASVSAVDGYSRRRKSRKSRRKSRR